MMNYAQITDQIEQLKIGKKRPDTKKLQNVYREISETEFTGKIISVPISYLEDSIGEYMESILKAHKYTVGRFTAFAMKKYTGSISICGKNISQKDFAKYGEIVLKHLEDKEASEQFTRLEVCLLIALLYFADKRCDYIILPERELWQTTEIYMPDKRNLQKQQFAIEGFGQLEVQRASYNEVTDCIMAIRMLQEKGFCLKENIVKKAIMTVKENGKFEILKTKPYFIIDGADDEMSVKVLMANLQYYFPQNPYIFIVGVLNENYEGIIKESAHMPIHILTISVPDMPNSLPAVELAKEYQKLNPNITNVSSIEEAVEIATMLSEKNTVVTVFGTTALSDKVKSIVIRSK